MICTSYLTVPIADFDERAATILENLRRQRIRIGTLDMRLAAIALACAATLITRNRVDFEHIPGLAIEDWSIFPPTAA